MKKLKGAARAVPPLDRGRLDSLSTDELLARLARLRHCEETRQASDMTAAEIAAADGILFKDSPEWRQAYDAVKEALAEREHRPRGGERRRQRIERAKRNRESDRRQCDR